MGHCINVEKFKMISNLDKELESHPNKVKKYITSSLNEYHQKMNIVKYYIPSDSKKTFYKLVKDESIQNIESSILEKTLISFLKNYFIAKYRVELKNL